MGAVRRTGADRLCQSQFQNQRAQREQGPIYLFLSLLNRMHPGKRLFFRLNKRNLGFSSDAGIKLFRSVAIKKHTPLNSILHLIRNAPETEVIVLMFHSVLNKSDAGYRKDQWVYDAGRFERLCAWLSEQKEVRAATLREIASE